ncbi:MAG: abortive phage infection protein [bacterium]|nr:abortive phage infection protein [bacterium]
MKVGDFLKQNIIEKLLAEKNGIVKTADVVAAGISKETFYKYAQSIGLEKAAHGIYLLPSAWADEMYLLQAQIPKAIYSHETSLYLHELAEMEPIPFTVTVPAKYNNPTLAEKGVKIIYTKKEWHMLGICQISSPSGHPIAVYNMERTICDIIRKRSDMDISTFNYALVGFMKRKDKNLNRLMEYAKTMRLEKKIRETMGVLF